MADRSGRSSGSRGSNHGAHQSGSPIVRPTFQPAVPTWKRALDLSVIAILVPLWVPVMLGIACLIKLVSRGPIVFKQERIGLGEKRFVVLKFRTMHVNAETNTHQKHLSDLLNSDAPMKKMDGADKRLIPFAWILRASGLDELPQIFNVLRGEMSLVGPRPCTPYEFADYKEWQRERFNTLPGLTGLWQVSGKNRTTFKKMIELDIHYARTACLWLDLGIMFRTGPALGGQFIESRIERWLLRRTSSGKSAPENSSVEESFKMKGVLR